MPLFIITMKTENDTFKEIKLDSNRIQVPGISEKFQCPGPTSLPLQSSVWGMGAGHLSVESQEVLMFSRVATPMIRSCEDTTVNGFDDEWTVGGR